MAGFNLIAQLQLQSPSNLDRVVGQIKNSVKNITADIDVRINPTSNNNLKGLNQNINVLNSSLKELRTNATAASNALSGLSRGFGNFGTASNNSVRSLQNAINTTKKLAETTKDASDATEEFGRAAGLAGRRFLGFSLIAGSVVTAVSAIKSGVTEALKFEREFVKISQLGGVTKNDLNALNNEITRLSTNLGVSSKDLIATSVTLRQAGLSVREVTSAMEVLAKTTLAPSFDNIKDTTEGAIAIMAQFRIEAKNLEGALASANAVANAFAVESKDIITAVQRSGGAFRSVGGDLNEFIALFTSVRSTTRESAESIATGLRTVFTRLQRRDTVEALKELGINLRATREEALALGQADLENQFVGGYEAVRRLSEGLKGLRTSDPRYSEVIEQLGGYRQISKVIPLIQEFSQSQKALNIAQSGFVSITTAAEEAQGTFIVQLQKIREEFLALTRTIVSSTAFKGFLGVTLDIANAFVKVTDALSPLIPLMAAFATVKIGAGLAGFFRGVGQGFGGTPPKRLATGGIVPGHGSGDTTPAMLTPGEFVVNKASAQSIGYGNLHRMNKYAAGGPVQKFKVGDFNLSDNNLKFMYQLANAKDGGASLIAKNQEGLKTLFGAAGTKSGNYESAKDVFKALGFPGQNLTELRKALEVNKSFVANRKASIASGSYVNNGNLVIPFKGETIGYVATGNPGGEAGKEGRDSLSAGLRVQNLKIGNLGEKTNKTAKALLKNAGVESITGGVNVHILGNRPTEDFNSRIIDSVEKNIQDVYVKEFGAGRVAPLSRAQTNTIAGYMFEKYVEGLSGKFTAGNESSFEYTKGNKPGSTLGKAFDKFVFPSPVQETYLDLKSRFQRDHTGDVMKKYLNTKSNDGTLAALLGVGGSGVESAGKGDASPAKLRFASGGRVPGHGNGDTVPAVLTPGEFVIKKSSAQAIGYDALHGMNKYADGGAIPKRARLSNRFLNGVNFNVGLDGPAVGLVAKSGQPSPVALQDIDINAFKGKAYPTPIRDLVKNLRDNGVAEEDLSKYIRVNGLVQRGVLNQKTLEKFQKNVVDKTRNSVNEILSEVPPIRGNVSPALNEQSLGSVIGNVFELYVNRLTGTPQQEGKPNFDYSGVNKSQLAAFNKVFDGGLTANYLDAKLNDSASAQRDIVRKGLNEGVYTTSSFVPPVSNRIPVKKASGGGTTDTVPALLTPGEFVINRASASRIGSANLHAMNQTGKIQGFANGGFVNFADGDFADDRNENVRARRRRDEANARKRAQEIEEKNRELDAREARVFDKRKPGVQDSLTYQKEAPKPYIVIPEREVGPNPAAKRAEIEANERRIVAEQLANPPIARSQPVARATKQIPAGQNPVDDGLNYEKYQYFVNRRDNTSNELRRMQQSAADNPSASNLERVELLKSRLKTLNDALLNVAKAAEKANINLTSNTKVAIKYDTSDSYVGRPTSEVLGVKLSDIEKRREEANRRNLLNGQNFAAVKPSLDLLQPSTTREFTAGGLNNIKKALQVRQEAAESKSRSFSVTPFEKQKLEKEAKDLEDAVRKLGGILKEVARRTAAAGYTLDSSSKVLISTNATGNISGVATERSPNRIIRDKEALIAVREARRKEREKIQPNPEETLFPIPPGSNLGKERNRSKFSEFFLGSQERNEDGTQKKAGLVSRIGQRVQGTGLIALSLGAGYAGQLFDNKQADFDNAAISGAAADKVRSNAGASGALTGAAAGAAFGSAFGPLGTVIGAGIGGLTGFTSSVKDAEKEIRSAKIGKAITDLTDSIQKAIKNNDPLNASLRGSLEKNLGTIREEVGSKSRLESTNSFFADLNPFTKDKSGLDVSKYTASVDKELRQSLGKELPDLFEILNRESKLMGEQFAKTNTDLESLSFEETKKRLNDLDRAFIEANRGLLEPIAQLKKVSVDEIAKDFRRSRLEGFSSTRRQNIDNRTTIDVGQQLNSLSRLATTVEQTALSMGKLYASSGALSDLFDGISSSNNLVTEGRLNGSREDFQSAVGGLRQIGGGGLADFASAFNDIKSNLSSVLVNVLSGNQLEAEDVGRKIREGITASITGGTGRKLTSQEEAIVAGVSREAGAIPVDELRTQGRTDINKLIEKLISGVNPTESLTKIFDTLAQNANRYTTELGKQANRLKTIGDSEDRLRNLQLARLRNSVEQRNRLSGTPGSALDQLSLDQLNAPIAGRAQALTGLGKFAENPNVINLELVKRQTQIDEAVKAQQQAFDKDGFKTPESREAADRLAKLKFEAGNLQTALRELTDTTTRNAAAQEKLNNIQQDRSSRLAFGEKFLSSGVQERGEINKGLRLTQFAASQGNLNNFSPENVKRVFETLNSLGNAKLTGLGGVRANDLKNKLIQSTFGGVFDIDTSGKNEEKSLIKSIEENFKTAEQAQFRLVEFQKNTNKTLTDDLRKLQEEFFSRLDKNIRNEEIKRLEQRIDSDKIGLGKLQQERGGAVRTLNDLGVTSDTQVDFLKSNKDIAIYRDAVNNQKRLIELRRGINPDNLNLDLGAFFKSNVGSGKQEIVNTNDYKARITDQLKQQAGKFGINLTDDELSKSVQNILKGSVDLNRDYGYETGLSSNEVFFNGRGAANRAFSGELKSLTARRADASGREIKDAEGKILGTGKIDSGTLNRIVGLDDSGFTKFTNALSEFDSKKPLSKFSDEILDFTRRIELTQRRLNDISEGRNPDALPIAPLPRVVGQPIGPNPQVISQTLQGFGQDIVQMGSVLNLFSGTVKILEKAMNTFPSTIKGEFTHTVNVNVTGAEALAAMGPELEKLAIEKSRTVLNNYIKNNIPDAGLV